MLRRISQELLATCTAFLRCVRASMDFFVGQKLSLHNKHNESGGERERGGVSEALLHHRYVMINVMCLGGK